MARGEIRLQYSGFIIFAAKLMSVASGMLFQLMIARSTSELEYDLWFNLNDVLAYFILLATAIPFWTMRFVARGEEGAAKTGVIANLIIAAIATAVYIPLVPSIASLLGIPQQYLMLYYLIGLQILELYSLNALQSCLQATIPQAIGYGLLVVEVFKVLLGYILIFNAHALGFHDPILGGLVSLMAAYAMQIVYYMKLLGGEFRQYVRWRYVKQWLKGSLANIYNVVGNQIANFVLIMLFAYGGEGARGRYGLARQIANVITYSTFLSFALQPKLLAEERHEDIATSLKMVLMFSAPMTVGAMALSGSYIIIMRDVVYRDAWPILVVLAADAFVMTISAVFSWVLFGVEDVDKKAEISFRELVRSSLFIAFSLPYLHSAITLPTAFFALTNLSTGDPLAAAIYVSIINMLTRLAMFVILYLIVRRMVKIDLPWSSIARYILCSAAMAAFLLAIPSPTRILSTLVFTAIGGSIYLGLLTIIDKEARTLFKSIWREIRSKIKR